MSQNDMASNTLNGILKELYDGYGGPKDTQENRDELIHRIKKLTPFELVMLDIEVDD